jgi:Tol biopolymer transport system component
MFFKTSIPKIILHMLLVITYAGCSIIETIKPQHTSTTSPIIETITINTPSHDVTPSIILTPTNSPTPELTLSGVIAFTNTSRSYSPIALLDLENGNIKDFSNNGIGSLSWSPDGLWLAFDGGIPLSQQLDLYKMRDDGTKLTRLTNSPQGKFDVAWSPDGSSIIFAYSNKGNPTDLAIIREDGSSSRLLTSTKGSERHPAWSPDGKQIAYTFSERYRDPEELWIMDAYGINPVRLSAAPFVYGGIDWSPNGEWIAFVSGEKANECGDIYVIKPDGSELSRLTDLSGCAHDVAWSPDGKYIAFIGSGDEIGNISEWGWQIYILDYLNKSVVAVTDEKEWILRNLEWRP